MKNFKRQFPNGLRKILLIRMSSIGDIILTSPLIRQLRKLYPDAAIDFLVRQEFAGLLESHPDIQRVISINVKEEGALKSLRAEIREAEYDVILDLHRNFRSLYLSIYPNNPPILAIRKNQLKRFLLVKFKLNFYSKSADAYRSVPEKYLQAASSLGVDTQDQMLSLHLPPAEKEKADIAWKELSQEGFQVVMAPGARHFTKRWPPEYYGELIRRLYTEKGWKTLLLGGPEERPLANEIREIAGADIVKNLCGEISLLQTLAMIRKAPRFLSNDSGLMHVAAAFQRPQIAIFGSTVQALGFFPVNPNARVLEVSDLSCRPCSHIGRNECPKGHFKCMMNVSPVAVYDALSDAPGKSSR